jgi:FkbM family methyltransferase
MQIETPPRLIYPRELAAKALWRVRFLLPHGHRPYHYPGGLVLIDARESRAMIRRILGAYEPWKVSLLRQIVRPGMTCVDVGANNGFFSFIMARLMSDEGRVLAFEPEPANRSLLDRGAELNGYRSVQSFELALSDGPGTLTFFAGKQSGWGSLIHRPGETLDDRYAFAVNVATLDSVIEAQGIERVDVMKVDVQGAELAVMGGSRNILGRSGPIWLLIDVDSHVESDRAGLFELLREHGFSLHRLDRSLTPVRSPNEIGLDVLAMK